MALDLSLILAAAIPFTVAHLAGAVTKGDAWKKFGISLLAYLFLTLTSLGATLASGIGQMISL